MFDTVASQVSALSFVDIFNFCVFLTFTICYTYQLFYVLVVLTRRAPKKVARANHRYAVMVAARNEETVIADLIHSIKVQNYPAELIDIFFRDSWNQRFRWAKGFYQVFAHYAGGLVKGTLTNPAGYRFACYDMLMTIAPGMLLSIISILFNTIIIVLAATGVMSTGVAIASSVTSVVFCLCNYIVFMFVFGVLTTFVEWDSIRTTTAKKIRYMFTFPFFMLTYIPIALIALVKKAAWKPIRHSISVDVAEFSEAEGVRLSSK